MPVNDGTASTEPSRRRRGARIEGRARRVDLPKNVNTPEGVGHPGDIFERLRNADAVPRWIRPDASTLPERVLDGVYFTTARGARRRRRAPPRGAARSAGHVLKIAADDRGARGASRTPQDRLGELHRRRGAPVRRPAERAPRRGDRHRWRRGHQWRRAARTASRTAPAPPGRGQQCRPGWWSQMSGWCTSMT